MNQPLKWVNNNNDSNDDNNFISINKQNSLNEINKVDRIIIKKDNGNNFYETLWVKELYIKGWHF